MPNPAIGEGPCPLGALAGEPHTAELVQEGRGARRALYFRCAECGGIQTRAPEGQRRIKALIQAGRVCIYNPETAAEYASHEAAEEATERSRQARGGWLGGLITDGEDL